MENQGAFTPEQKTGTGHNQTCPGF